MSKRLVDHTPQQKPKKMKVTATMPTTKYASPSSLTPTLTPTSSTSTSTTSTPTPTPTLTTSFGPGCDACVVPLHGVDAFELALRTAATAWFRAQLQLSQDHHHPHNCPTMSDQLRTTFQTRRDKHQRLKLPSLQALTAADFNQRISAHLYRIDFSNDTVFQLIFDNKKRKQWLQRVGVPQRLVNNVSTIVRYGLNGGGYCNQGAACAKSWTGTGFGFWPHVRGLAFVKNMARPAAERVIGATCGGAMGVLFRPPVSTPLHEHVDGSMAEMLRRTRAASSMEDWTNKWGYQALLHMKGGRREARTCVLGPLGLPRYRALLLLVHPNQQHSEAPPCSPQLWGNGNGAINWKVEGSGASGWETIRPLANRLYTWLSRASSVDHAIATAGQTR
jgi:hypothetical protein